MHVDTIIGVKLDLLYLNSELIKSPYKCLKTRTRSSIGTFALSSQISTCSSLTLEETEVWSINWNELVVWRPCVQITNTIFRLFFSVAIQICKSKAHHIHSCGTLFSSIKSEETERELQSFYSFKGCESIVLKPSLERLESRIFLHVESQFFFSKTYFLSETPETANNLRTSDTLLTLHRWK